MKKERLYYVDWLRVLVILTLIPYHSALTYTGLGDTYIISPLKDLKVLPFLIITAPLDNFFMTLLFFLSGIGTYYALQYRSRREYLNERISKLLIPLQLGIISICPLQAYFKGLKEGFLGNFISFLPQFFSGKIAYYYGYAHLWFLFYLLIFSGICFPLFTRWVKESSRLEKITSFICKGNNIYIPMAFIILVETCLRPFYQGPYTIIMDWTNDIVYLSVFIYGFIFASDSRIQERINRITKTLSVIAIMCIPILIFMYYLWAVCNSSEFFISIAWAFTKGVYECSAIIMLIGIAKKYLNKKSSLIIYLNKASFTYYYWHYLPVSFLTYCFIRTRLNVYAKYLLVVILSYLFILSIYELVVKRLFGSIKRSKDKLLES
jgi:glucans biosynthesis protein C